MAISAASLSIDVTADTGKAESGLKGLSSQIQNVVGVAAGFTLGNAISKAPAQFIAMGKAAADDAASVTKLQAAVDNTAGGWTKYSKQINDAISQGQKLAFSDDQVRDALSTMTAQTGDAGEALKRLHTAQDLARGSGLDLSTAARLLGKVTDDNVTALQRYGITVEKGASAQDLLNQVDARFGGQAGKFAASDAGKFAMMADNVGELQEALGAALLPALSAASAGVNTFVGVMQKVAGTGIGAEVFEAMAAAIGGVLVLAFGAAAVSAGAAAVAFIAANAAALPWIALAAAIGIGIFELIKHWDDLTARMPILQTALDAVKTGFHDFVMVIIAGGTALGQVVSNIVDVFKAGFNVITTVVQSVGQVFDDVIHGHFLRAKDDAVQGAKDIADAYVGYGDALIHVFDDVGSSFEQSIQKQQQGAKTAGDAFLEMKDSMNEASGQVVSGATIMGEAFRNQLAWIDRATHSLDDYRDAAENAWVGQQTLAANTQTAAGQMSFWEGNLKGAKDALQILQDQQDSGTPLNDAQQSQYDELTHAIGRYQGGIEDTQGAVVDAAVEQAKFIDTQDALKKAYDDNVAAGMSAADAQGIYNAGMADAVSQIDPATAAANGLTKAQNDTATAMQTVVDKITDLLVKLGLIPPDASTTVTVDTTDADGNITSTNKLMQDYAKSNPNTAVTADTSAADKAAATTAALMDAYAKSNPNTTVSADTSTAESVLATLVGNAGAYALLNPSTLFTADTATAETNVSNLQGDIDGVPSAFTITANVDIAPAMDRIQQLRNNMPFSPAKEGPFSKLPNWSVITEGIAPAFQDAIGVVQQAGAVMMGSLGSVIDAGAKAIGHRLRDAGVEHGQIYGNRVREGAEAALDTAPTIGDLILAAAAAGVDPLAKTGELAGKDVVDALVNGVVAGLPEWQNIFELMHGDALTALAQMQTDLEGKIRLAGIAGEDTADLQAKLDAVTQIIATWAEQTGLDFQEEVNSILAPDISPDITQGWLDLLGNIDDIISGDFQKGLQDKLATITNELTVAVATGAPQSVIDALTAQQSAIEAQLTEAGLAYQAAIDAGMTDPDAWAQTQEKLQQQIDDTLSYFDNLASGDALTQAQAAMDKANQELAIARATGASQDVINAIMKEFVDAQAAFNKAAGDTATLIAEGLASPEAIKAYNEAMGIVTQIPIDQLLATLPEMSDFGASLLDDLAAGVVDGSTTLDDAMSVINGIMDASLGDLDSSNDLAVSDMIAKLQELEGQLTGDLADALVKGSDPSAIEANLQAVEAMLAQLNSATDESAQHLAELGGYLNDTAAAMGNVASGAKSMYDALYGGLAGKGSAYSGGGPGGDNAGAYFSTGSGLSPVAAPVVDKAGVAPAPIVNVTVNATLDGAAITQNVETRVMSFAQAM